jgi:hypothetical protein
MILTLFDFFLHLDAHLSVLIENYGVWTYAILSAIIFAETGFVVTPFLPGDSLIFAAATFAGLGLLNPMLLFQARVSRTNARFLRKVRRQNDHSGQIHSHHPHICAICRRRGRDDLSKIYFLQCDRCHPVGGDIHHIGIFLWQPPRGAT